MNKLMVGLGFAVIAVIIAHAPALAASNLASGNVGQLASNTSSLGVSVCNNGDTASTGSVPVVVTANNTSVTVQSAPSLAAGACAYTYVPYSSLNMASGQTYTVSVSVSGNTSSYTVAVPGLVLGASTGPISQTNLNLMANEIVLLKQLIALLEAKLGL